MARSRSPNREAAFELYKKNPENITNREIAKLLNEDEKVIAVWKSRDKWIEKCNVVQQSNQSCTTKENKVKKTKQTPIADEVEEVLNNTELTDKQRLFCLYYSKSFNATRSYMKAYGCDEYTGMSNGSRLLSKAKIKDEIHRLKQERMNREFLSEADIFQKYMDIAFADITDFLEFGQEEVPVMTMFGPMEVKDEKTGEKIKVTKVINTVRFKESHMVDGTIISEVKQGKDGASIKLADRMKALEWLTTHMNMATEEQKARIALLKAKANLDEEVQTEDDGFLDALTGKVDDIWQEG